MQTTIYRMAKHKQSFMATAPRETTMVPEQQQILQQQHHRWRRRRAVAGFCALAMVGTVAFAMKEWPQQQHQLQSFYYYSNHDEDEIIITKHNKEGISEGIHRILTHGMTIEHPSAVHGSTLEHPNAIKRKAIMDELADINIWGTPAKLTSFGYKWVDDKCSVDETLQPRKKKRAALCLYGGLSPNTHQQGFGEVPDISNLSNVDWAATLYDKNLLPEGDFELDLFIHTWSETYFCTITKSFDGTRFTVRSIIAEPNERHMNELFPLILTLILHQPTQTKKKQRLEKHGHLRQASMYFTINKSLALALDYSNNCGFEYDILIAARPDVLLGEPLSFYNQNGTESTLHRALAPHNEVLHSYILGKYRTNGDFHYIFNPTTARIFVEKMFPPPDQKWPDMMKLTKIVIWHSGWVQEFAGNNGIAMSNHGFGPPHEEVARKIWQSAYHNEHLQHLQYWRKKLDFLGLPDHCFPSTDDGWQRHVDSKDPQCYPKFYDAMSSCPSNQNVLFSATTI